MSTLVNKNVMVDGRRTSMRLEPEMWQALQDICRLENIKIGRICTMVNKRKGESSLTSAMRVFIISYFRALAMADMVREIQSDAMVAERELVSCSPYMRQALSFRAEQQMAQKPTPIPRYN